MRCCVPHITVPVVDEIWPRTVLCTIFVSSTAVELQNSVLLFIIMNAKHSWHDIFCWALEEELLVIMVHVASPVALRHWSIDNSLSLPQPLTLSLWLLFILCTLYKASPWYLLHMTWRGPSQSFWYAASPPVSTEQKTTSTATVIDDLKRDCKYTLSYTLNKTLASHVKLALQEVSASGYYLARLCW